MDDCRILGMDNSTKSTGWAVVDVVNGQPVLVDYGLIKRGSRTIAEVLVNFETVFTDLITRFKPDHVSAEQMFIGANRTTAMALAYVHGVMLLTAQKLSVPVTYYSVMTAKRVTMGGHMSMYNARGERKTSVELKTEVQNRVFEVLGRANFDHEFTDDVTDACSLALTYLYTGGVSTERRATPVKSKATKPKKVAKPKATQSKTTQLKKATKPKATKKAATPKATTPKPGGRKSKVSKRERHAKRERLKLTDVNGDA